MDSNKQPTNAPVENPADKPAEAPKSKAKKVWSIIGNVLLWIFVAFSVVVTVLAFMSNSNSDGVPTIGGKVISPVLTPSMEPTIKKGDILLSQKLFYDTSKNKFYLESDKNQEVTLEAGDIISFKADLDGNNTPEINTHRIVEVIVDEAGFVSYKTQGDNNTAEDAYEVYPSDVISVSNLNREIKAITDKGRTSLAEGTVIKFEKDIDNDGTAEEHYHIITEVVRGNDTVTAYKTKSIEKSSITGLEVSPAEITATVSENISSIPVLGNVINFLMQPTGFFICIVIPLILFFLFEIIMFVRKVIEVKNADKKQITAEDEELIKKRAIEEYIRSQNEAAAKATDDQNNNDQNDQT